MLFGRFSSSCGLLGVDIGSRSIRLLQLRAATGGRGGGGGDLAVVGAGEVNIAAAQQGEIGPADLSLGERLRALFTSGGFTGRRCVVSLPRADLSVQAVRLPSVRPGAVPIPASWEVQIIRLSPSAAPAGAGGCASGAGDSRTSGAESREEVLLIAVPHPVIHARLNPILEAGLRPVAIDTHFCALARALSRQFRREGDRQYVRVVLEVGYSGSTVLILRGSEIAFCKLLTIGGREFNRAVAEHLRIDDQSAAELRAAASSCLWAADSPETDDPSGTASPDLATDRAIYEATRPLMGELARDVALMLRYYGVTFRGRPAYQAILTGGECHGPHMANMLRSACKLPVVVDDEAQTMERLLPGIGTMLHRSPGPASAWVVAAGLSIREFRERDQAQSRSEERSDVRSAETDVRGQKRGSEGASEAGANRVACAFTSDPPPSDPRPLPRKRFGAGHLSSGKEAA